MKEFWKKSNIPTMLLALVLSLSLWTTVQLGSAKVRQETISNVPVRILEESTLRTNTGFSVIEGYEATIRVDYEAIGASVAELKKRNMEDFYAEASVGAITEPGRTKVRYTLHYPDNLNISVRSSSPRLVEVWVDEIITRDIRVEPYTDGSPAEGYLYDRITPDHETVTVQGPAQVVNQISYARATLTADGVTGSLTDLASISFLDVEGNLLDAEANHLEIMSGDINLSLSVLKEGIVPLYVDVLEAPGITAGMAQIDISPQSIKVRGEPLLVDRLTEEGIHIGTIDLNRLSEGGTQTLPIRTPNGVSRTSGEASSAKVRVTVQGVSTRRVDVSDVTVDLGENEGWDAILVSGVVPVTVRGPAQLVENFDEGRLHAVATLAPGELTPGIRQAALTVTLEGSGTDGIAVMNAPATVNIMLRQSAGQDVPEENEAESEGEPEEEPSEPVEPVSGEAEAGAAGEPGEKSGEHGTEPGNTSAEPPAHNAAPEEDGPEDTPAAPAVPAVPETEGAGT